MPPLEEGVPVGIVPWRLVAYIKTRMVYLPDSEKNFEDMFIRFHMIHERVRHAHTHRQRMTA